MHIEYAHTQIFSDRPASEVLASAAISAEQAITTDQVTSPQSTTKILLPSHHGLMVGDRKIIVAKNVYKSCYSQGTAIFEYVPTEKGATHYMYKPRTASTHGPGVPDLEELDSYGYVAHCVY